LAQSIAAMSDGRLKVTVYLADTLVKAFEVFDAVSASVADMYVTDEKYFQEKSSALNFFAAVPYGVTADELYSWILFGVGQALWNEVDAQFNIKPLMALNTGVQMGGCFNKEVNTPEDFKGLRYRMPELGAEVLRRMGATVVTTLPARSNLARSMPASSSNLGQIFGSGSTRQPIIITRASMSPATMEPSASIRRCGMD
jgi:TRAP-type mannitol/chloroaromatic compound transport system substrate-binding protein